ncbi:hypothetical protein scyTo_0021327, partial [Scyliorhinus torazame]|nr:hypothetical protein [Scyliorhinus torazame]
MRSTDHNLISVKIHLERKGQYETEMPTEIKAGFGNLRVDRAE